MLKGTLSLSNDAIPNYSPPYPTGPYDNEFEDINTTVIQYRVAGSEIRHLIPDIMEIEEETLMTSTFVHYGKSSVGSYNEFVLQAEVRFNGQKYHYSIILILDNESAIFAGRELFGIPKVFGKVDIKTSTGSRLYQGTVERPVGTPIVHFNFIPERRVESVPKDDTLHLGLRSIPSLANPQTAAIKELVPSSMEWHVKSAWIGKGSLVFTPGTLLHPWADLKILRYEGAIFSEIPRAFLRPGKEVFPL